ncbi:rod shape-determining protein RodA [SCandidatus Aminicenantes bacterium Aminicenantia_JdfR_composite]|jgi:rod shape determining protein RodA|nr:rod shape-determining protein RodA [SCandidatus Aminicenantes bacterium Aminicenantia_JdfR_composite]MCP2605900.1 rod shape-determining protein RodA [Candidatus Aminicenantes bacterium AC-335-O07]MCP2620571.1 rod shape-determining protein RodA [Candidatus Aminicenantes bacterium AC-334-E05]
MDLKRIIDYFDWALLGVALMISVIGVLAIHSSTHYISNEFYVRQIIWIIIGLISLFLIVSVDYNYLINYSPYFYFSMLFILILMLLFGNKIGGSRSWLNLKLFNIQPSEFTKIAIILFLIYILSHSRWDYISWRDKLMGSFVVLTPVILVALQPDLGTAMTYLPVYFGALFITGFDRKIIATILIVLIFFGAISWLFLLKDYQKQRIIVFLFPGKDPLKTGYHVIQSKIAIGSGGFLGKGYKKGTQSQLRFLPARHTDFILSVIGEEFGYVGIFILLSLYFLLFYKIFNSIKEAKDRTGIYLVYFVGILLFFQFFVNGMMVIGFFPIAGIPMPLLSYGGSSLLTTYIFIGLIINVKMRKFIYG